MKKKSKNKRNLFLIILIVLGIILGIIFVFVQPLINNIYDEKDSLEENKLKIEDLKKESTKTKEYREQKEDLELNQGFIEKAVIKKEEEIKFIETLENVAENAGAKASIELYVPPKVKKKKTTEANKEADNETEEEKKNKSYFMISLKGSYKQFLTYFYELENLNYIFKISSVNVRAISELDLKNKNETERALDKDKIQADILISFNVQ